jgi:hypothetical protein
VLQRISPCFSAWCGAAIDGYVARSIARHTNEEEVTVKLAPRYKVINLETGRTAESVDFGQSEPYFVLSPERDPAALEALKRYAEVCEPELAKGIRDWIGMIEGRSGKNLGKVGEVNARHMKVFYW